MSILPKVLGKSMNCGKSLASLYRNKRSVALLWRLFTSEKSVNLDNHQQGQTCIAEADITQVEITNDKQHQIEKVSRDLEVISNKVKLLKESSDKLFDKYRRALASNEHLRSRFHEQILEAKLFGMQDICKDLIEVADVLGRTIDSVPQDQLTDENEHLKNLFNGLIMTQITLFQVFKCYGLEPMDPLKEKYDPKVHEAFYQEENSSVAPGTIIEVVKLGYNLHNQVIRPALVGVSK